ncbi:unnamed protein product [Phyllotreta striolata]|uniref:Nonstructural protein WIV domain-containing protein n=1 Tax=Phyllotreta striolata TaxID=444603 RepID=A0A9N9XJM7_PHYSR|nr:unnamed protein product [Phyllotreta striolata]
MLRKLVLFTCLAFSQIECSGLQGGQVAVEFVRRSLDIQYDLAAEVKRAVKEPIYVFDASGTFKDARPIIVGHTRVLKTDDGKFGVLSESAQFAFAGVKDYLQFTNRTFDSDSTGLYM